MRVGDIGAVIEKVVCAGVPGTFELARRLCPSLNCVFLFHGTWCATGTMGRTPRGGKEAKQRAEEEARRRKKREKERARRRKKEEGEGRRKTEIGRAIDS